MKKLLLSFFALTLISIASEVGDSTRTKQFNNFDERVLTHFKVIDDNKNAKLQYRRGLNYEKGLVRNYKKALEFYKKAAKLGLPEAQTRLATMYYLGKGVRPDNEKAMEWYQKAVEQNFAKAEYNLGVMHSLDRKSQKKNKVLAYKYWKKAASKGHKLSQYKIDVFCGEYAWACK